VLLLLDNFDSFTYNLLDYFAQLGLECKVVRNNVSIAEIEALDFQAIILSPGPGRPAEAGCLMEVIERYHQRLPILGICLGHQALGEFFGARLEKAAKPMHGKVAAITCQPDPLFQELPRHFNVVRYHSLLLTELTAALEPLAETVDGRELMIMRHRNLPLYGIQFHPEAWLTEHGLSLLRNWARLSGLLPG